MKAIPVVLLLVFFNLTPEQESEIHFPADDHFITVPGPCHGNIHEDGIIDCVPQERIADVKFIRLIPHIRDAKRIFWPLIEMQDKSASGITESTIAAFYHLHGSKGNRFAALFILDNTSEYFRLGAHTEGYEEQQEGV